MRRPFAAPEPATEDFSGLLERLARTVSEEGSGVRKLSPVAEAEPRRGRATSDTVSLSYEQALRTHSRYHPPASVAAPATGAAAKASAAATTEASSPLPDRATDRIAAPVAGKAAGPAKSRSRGRRDAARRGGPDLIAPEKAALVREAAGKVTGQATAKIAEGAAPAVLKARAESALESVASEKTRESKIVPGQPKKTKRIAVGGKEGRSHPERKTGRRKLPGKKHGQPGSGAREWGAAGETIGKRTTVASLSAKKVALESPRLSVAAPTVIAAEFRRSSVSVRLSAGESEQLRQRAIESGLSVSAYMRSCVLEADHLRFQVKQALAQMRARAPAAAETDAALIPALGYGERSGLWSRLFSKSVALFLGPWYPLRRSA